MTARPVVAAPSSRNPPKAARITPSAGVMAGAGWRLDPARLLSVRVRAGTETIPDHRPYEDVVALSAGRHAGDRIGPAFADEGVVGIDLALVATTHVCGAIARPAAGDHEAVHAGRHRPDGLVGEQRARGGVDDHGLDRTEASGPGILAAEQGRADDDPVTVAAERIGR